MKPITKYTKKLKQKTPTYKKMGTTLKKNSPRNDQILIVLQKTKGLFGNGLKAGFWVYKLEALIS